MECWSPGAQDRSKLTGRTRAALASVCAVVLMIAGCAIGPTYKRPPVNSPAGFRDATNTVSTNSFADLPWWDVFDDPILTRLLHDSYANNLTVRAAGSQILLAQLSRQIAASELLPQAQTFKAREPSAQAQR